MNQGQNLTSELRIHLRESSTSVKVISTVVFISQVWLKLKSCAFLVLFLILLLVFFFQVSASTEINIYCEQYVLENIIFSVISLS